MSEATENWKKVADACDALNTSLHITKELFCECARIYKEYGRWEAQLYGIGFDLADSPVAFLADQYLTLMCHGDNEWAYDRKLGIDWICEWAFNDHEFEQHRHGQEFIIDSAGALYDFIVFMNEHGWED
jgi:hypothetical protein